MSEIVGEVDPNFVHRKDFEEQGVAVELFKAGKAAPERALAKATVLILELGWEVTGYTLYLQRDGRAGVLPPYTGGVKRKDKFRAFRKTLKGDKTAVPIVSLILQTYEEACLLTQKPPDSAEKSELS